MARMSLPQIVDDFILINTSPCPGSGISTSFNTTVLSPGK